MPQDIFWSETAQAALDGERLGLIVLARLGFADGEERVCSANGLIELGGELWKGFGEWISLSQISSGVGDAAVPVILTLSGVDGTLMAKAARQASEVRGRPVTIYFQFFAGDTGKPLDGPVAVFSGRMDRVVFEGDSKARSIQLICESWLSARSKPPAGLYTPVDQRARHPTDRGLEFVSALVQKTVKWPAA